MKRSLRILILLTVVAGSTGCVMTHYQFQDAPPVQSLDDRAPSPLPQKTEFDFVAYAVSSSVRYPFLNDTDVRRVKPSADVNSADQVPASAWYTPRLGYRTISPDQLLKAATEVGPPKLPLRAVSAKTEGNNPGLVVEDARQHRYLVKFDLPEHPYLDTTSNLVVNRLFWGFGYNVPEDYLFTFKRSDLSASPDGGISETDIEEVLLEVIPEPDDSYRATASLYLSGEVLGPIPQRGTRRGDVNDRIPHENLRVLRALRMFCAFTNQTGIRSDNTLDVYVGEPGRGHTVHYLLDFGEALGGHGANWDWMWDGFEHFFSFRDSLRKSVSFGFPLKAWEKLEVRELDPKSHFEAEAFDPAEWREVYQFDPIQKSQPDDDYWAAKILGSVTREHLETLLKAARYPEKDYVAYLADTLMTRREKILRYALDRVSPIESSGVHNGQLELNDVGRTLIPGVRVDAYKVRFFNRGHKEVQAQETLSAAQGSFTIPLTAGLLRSADGYLRVEVLSVRNGKPAPRAAQFHIRQTADDPKLVGVVH